MRRAILAAVLALSLLTGQLAWADGGSATSVTSATFQAAPGGGYTVAFTTSATGSLTGPAGFISLMFSGLTVTGATYSVTAGSSGIAVSGSVAGSILTLTLDPAATIGANTAVSIGLQNLTSPSSPTVTIRTSSDTLGAVATLAGGGSPPGGGGSPAPTSVQNPRVAPSPDTAGATATYTVALAVYSAMGPGGTISLTAPGTTFPAQAADYTITDTTTPSSGAATALPSLSAGSVTLTVPNPIAAGDDVTVTIAGADNPRTAGDLQMAVATSADVSPAMATYTIVSAQPSRLAFTTQPGGGIAGSAWGTQPAVAVEDPFGNLVTTASATVALSVYTNPGSGALSCTGGQGLAATGGVAAFQGCAINQAGTGYQLLAQSGALTSAVSDAFNVVAGALPDLTVATARGPATATAGASVSVSWTVYNSGAAAATGAWYDAVYLWPSSTLGPGTTPFATVSESVHSPLAAGASYIDAQTVTLPAAPPASYDLIFQTNATGSLTVSGSTYATFAVPITVTAPKLAFTTQPGGGAPGVAWGVQPVVTAEDGSGATLPSFSGEVTLALAPNPESASLTCTGGAVAAAVYGVAAFSGCSVDKAGSGYTLMAAAAGATPATSAQFTIGAPAASGAILAVGGTAGGTVTGAMSQFLMGDNCWSSECQYGFAIVPPAPIARTGLASVFSTADHRLYAVGGAGASGNALSTLEAYDPLINCWTDQCSGGILGLPAMPTARYDLAAALDPGSGIVYAIGGAATGGSPLATVEGYHPRSNAWQSAMAMPTARYGLAVVQDPSTGLIYAIGGTGVGGNPLATLEAFNPQTNAWQTLASMPTPRTGLAAALGADGRIYAIGGTGANGVVASVEAYDPALNSWTAVASMPTARTGLAAVAGGDGRIYAIGGRDGNGNPLATVEAYTPSTNSWAEAAALPVATYGLAAAAVSGVAGVSASPSVATAGASATYTVTFSATSGLSAGESVLLVAPSGTAFPSGNPGAYTVDGIAAESVSASGNDASITVPSGVTASAGGSVTVTVAGVTNPASVAANDVMQVSTAADPAPEASNYYAISAGLPAKLAFTQQPGDAAAGQPLSPQPGVAVEDAAGNVVSSSAPIKLALANPNGATLTCAANPVNAVNGVASFSGCAVDQAANGYLLIASSSGLSSATSAGFNVAGSSAASLAVSAPASAIAGLPFAITVTAEDANGNTVTGFTGTVRFAVADDLATLPAAYTFTGTDQGSHSFTVTLATAGSRTVTARDSTTTPSISGSATVMVDAAPVSQLVVSLPSTQQTAGAPFGLTVLAEDPYGNLGTGYVGTVHFATTDGNAPNGSSPVLPADYTFTGTDAGQHTFSGIALYNAGTATVTATDIGTPSITGTSSAITVAPGAATQLAFTRQPGGGAAGAAWTTQPVVAVEDGSGNTVTSSSASVKLAIQPNPGGATLACTANPVSAASGVSTFSGCSIANAGTGYTLAATSTGLTSATSSAFAIGGGQLTITTPTTLPAAIVNQPYSATLSATGGTPAYRWTASGLPSWLSISPSGLLSATEVGAPYGPIYGFTIQVKDSGGTTVSETFSLQVDASTVTGPTVQANPATAFDADATYTIAFTTSISGALAPGDSMTLEAPAGTVFSGVSTDYTLQGGSVPITAVSVSSYSPGVTITLGGSIPASTPVALVARNVGNPPAPSATDSLSVFTSQDAQSVPSAPYAITAIPAPPASLAGSTIVANPSAIYYDVNHMPSTLTVAVAVYLRDGSTPLAGKDVTLRGTFPATGYGSWTFLGASSAQTGAGGDADFSLQCNLLLAGPYCASGSMSFAATDTTDGVVIAGPTVPMRGYNIYFPDTNDPGSVADLDASGLPASQAVTATFNGSPVALSGACTTNANGDVGSGETGSAGCTFVVPPVAPSAHYPVVLTVGGVVFATQFYVAPNPAGTASAIAANAGTPQSAEVGTAFATDLRAAVTDANGNGVSGVTVTFTVHASSGGASATFAGGGTTATAQTGGSGVATAPTLTANTRAGTFTVTASATGTGSTGFALTVTAGAPASIQVSQGYPQATVVGTRFAEPLQVEVQDRYGNPVPSAPVTFTPPASGAGTAQSAIVASTTAGGLAQAAFTANGTIGQFQVDATVPGVSTPAVFNLTNASELLSSCDPATFAATISGQAPIWLLFPPNCTVAPTQTIVIQAGQDVTLDGTNNSVNFDGTTAGQIFDVEGGSLTLIDLSVVNGHLAGQAGQNGQNGTAGSSGGNAQGVQGGNGGQGDPGTAGAGAQGGAMYIAAGATVDLVDTTFSSDTVTGGRGGDGGRGGNGGDGGPGGLASGTGNTVLGAADGGNGGDGGYAAPGGNSQGGAIYNAGTLTITGGSFQSDQSLGGQGGNGGLAGEGGNGGIGMNGPKGQAGADESCQPGTGGGTGQPGGAGGDAGSAGASQAGASGGNGQGGAIYNAGTLKVTGTTFSSDIVRGGSGGIGGTGYGGGWGGIGGIGGSGGNGGKGGDWVFPNGVKCKNASKGGGGGGTGGTGGMSGKSGNGSFAGAGGAGGAAEGAAIFDAGTLTAGDVTFAGNLGNGGNGGSGGNGGNAAMGPVSNGGGGAAGGCTKYISPAFPKGQVYPPCGTPGKGGKPGYGKQYGLGRPGEDGGPGGAAAGGAIYATASSTASLSAVTYGANNGAAQNQANLVTGGQGGLGGAGGYSKCALLASGGAGCFITYGGGPILTGKQQPSGNDGTNGPGAGADLFTAGANDSQLQIVTDSLPGGSVGGGYWGWVQATGGTTPYAWSVQGSLPPGLSLGTTYGNLSGTIQQAGTYLFTVQVQDSSTPALTATQALSITIPAQAVYQSGSTVAGSSNAASTSPNGSATAGGAGTPTSDVTATASNGAGQVAVTDYNANPGSGVSFQSTGQYFDVALSSGNTFQSVTIQKCGVTAGDTVMWSPDGVSWRAVDPQSYSNGCIALGPLTNTSSPTLAQLNGTPFAVAATPSPLAAGDTLTFSFTPLAAAGSLAPGDTITGAVYARTAGGDPVTGATVYLSASAGADAAAEGTALTATPAPFTTDAGGQVAIVYTAGQAASGTDAITAASEPGATPAMSATTTYSYAAPTSPPAAVTLLADPSQAAPGAPVTISGAVHDGAGDPVAGAVVDLSTTAGSLDALSVPTAADGSYSTTLTMPPAGGATLAASVEGASPSLTAMAIVTPPGITVTGTATGATTAGGTGATAPTTARGTGGSGSITVSEYSGDPGGPPTFTAAGAYFDVALAPGSTYSTLTITQCGVAAGQQLYWWNGSAWAPASVRSATGGCATATVTAASSPSLADLTGTPFAVGGAATVTTTISGSSSATTAPAAATAASVGTSGGKLATADGDFTLTLAAGELAAGQTLAATDTATAPAALPAGMAAVGPFVTLSGGPLAHPAAATFRYEAGFTEPDRISVYALGGAGWTFLPTARADGAVSAFLPGPGTYVALAATTDLNDVPSGFWAASAIDQALAAGIASGFPDGSFLPGAPVTRAQLAKMLVLALGLAPQIQSASRFADVAAGAWYDPYVGAAAQAGIVVGVTPTRFAPDLPVTREEMAVMVARAFRLTGGRTAPFTDSAAIDAWAAAGVRATVAAGYMGGFPDGSFQPLAAATRAQTAKVLAAAIATLAP